MNEAIENRAAGLCVSTSVHLPDAITRVPLISVADTRRAMPVMAAEVHGNPSLQVERDRDHRDQSARPQLPT